MFLITVATVFAALFVVPLSNAQSQSPNVQDQQQRSTDFTLTVRRDNNAYGTAAYSFRFATQDLQSHRNLVDLVYNGCGQLHINAHGRMRNRIVDLGAVEFAEEHEVPKNGWRTRSIQPQEDHVYIQEINDGRQTAYVKFKVTEIQQDRTLKVKWSPLTADKGMPQFRGGGAGTMGQCGGLHRES